MIAFTKFPITCMVEIDGIQWEKLDKLMSLEEYSKRMIEVLKENNIAFTIHWGKNANWGFPKLAETMYQDNAEKWIQIRSAFLSEDMAKVFSNDFLGTIGLAKYQENVLEDIIASTGL